MGSAYRECGEVPLGGCREMWGVPVGDVERVPLGDVGDVGSVYRM